MNIKANAFVVGIVKGIKEKNNYEYHFSSYGGIGFYLVEAQYLQLITEEKPYKLTELGEKFYNTCKLSLLGNVKALSFFSNCRPFIFEDAKDECLCMVQNWIMEENDEGYVPKWEYIYTGKSAIIGLKPEYSEGLEIYSFDNNGMNP